MSPSFSSNWRCLNANWFSPREQNLLSLSFPVLCGGSATSRLTHYLCPKEGWREGNSNSHYSVLLHHVTFYSAVTWPEICNSSQIVLRLELAFGEPRRRRMLVHTQGRTRRHTQIPLLGHSVFLLTSVPKESDVRGCGRQCSLNIPCAFLHFLDCSAIRLGSCD